MIDEGLPVVVFEFCGGALEVRGDVAAAEEVNGLGGTVHEIRGTEASGFEVGFGFHGEALTLAGSLDFKSAGGEFDAGVVVEAANHVGFDELGEGEEEF